MAIEVGDKYGTLTVLARCQERHSSKTGKTSGKWLCRCECGVTRDFLGGNLHKIKSCGCQAKAGSKQRGMGQYLYSGIASSARTVFGAYQGNARRRGYGFDLTFEEWLALSQQPCVYCGEPPSNVKTNTGKTVRIVATFRYSGVDRIDNSRGYVAGNCVPCCKHCNYAKRERTQQAFLDWVRRLYSHTLVQQQQAA